MANYRNDFADVNLETGTICRNFMNHSIGSGDALGDRFGVRVFRNGEPVSLGGTCAGYFVRNTTGETVVISSGVVSGNEAYVTLPAACYAVEGSFTLAIKVTSGSETVTMRIIDGVVSRTNTSVTVDPGTLVPSIETLISAINSAVGQIPVNYNASFAPAYSASSTYAVGEYVTYDGYLWRCTTAITETESWTAAHWTKVALASDVSDLKSAINFDEYLINEGKYTIKKTDLESGLWSYSSKSDNTARARTKNLLPVRAGMIINYTNTTYDIYMGVLETETSNSYLQTIGWKTDASGTIKINYDGWLTFYIRNHADTSATVDPSAFDGVVTLQTIVRTDIDDNKDLIQYQGEFQLLTFLPGFITTNGAIGTQVSYTVNSPTGTYKHCIVNCAEGDQFYINGTGGSSSRLWCFVDSNDQIISHADASITLEKVIMTAPANSAKLILNSSSGGRCFKGIIPGVRLDTIETYGEIMREDNIDWYQGSWTATGTKLNPNPSPTNKIRTNIIPFTQSIHVRIKSPLITIAYFLVDKNGDYSSTRTIPSGTREYDINPEVFINGNYREWSLTFIATISSGTVSPSDAPNLIDVFFYDNSIVKNGKQVFVYQFGGNGNDWCFVRLPANYNQFRQKPYPFVICNHGNSWVMDGTIEKANWTKITMYVPLDDPDYISNPTWYNGTDDESLWYSNPTIEALLSTGYVVCGCENYADGLYGNNNCRNACVDFFYHMIKTYNVEKRCSMIGSSNGAMTTLNASYLLQGAVKSICLLYPLTCLVNTYYDLGGDDPDGGFRPAIRSAYGITNKNITREELTVALATHDPLTVDVVDGMKSDVFPAAKLWYSPGDQLTRYQANSIALIDMLTQSNKVVQGVQVTGHHGDPSHFDPAAIVAWFNAN